MKIIKFTAIWCPGCLVMKKVWNNIEKKYNIETNDYDYDIDYDLREKFAIGKTLPVTIFLDKDDRELERLVGEVSEKKLIDTIEKYREM